MKESCLIGDLYNNLEILAKPIWIILSWLSSVYTKVYYRIKSLESFDPIYGNWLLQFELAQKKEKIVIDICESGIVGKFDIAV